MKICIDLSSAAKPYPTGIGRYGIEYVQALLPLLERSDQLRLVVRLARWRWRHFLSALPLHIGTLTPLWAGRSRIFHSTGLSLSRGVRSLKITTVHDVNTLDKSDLASPRWTRARSRKTRQVVGRADMILTVSDFVRQRLLHHFPDLEPNRVRVTPLGVDHAELSPTPTPEDAAVLRRLELNRPYILNVGRLGLRKNTDGLVCGFSRSRAAQSHLLVFAGLASASDARRAIGASGVSDRVRFLGWRNDSELGPLYRGADAFAAPSRYEGFGLPLAEALACGTPALTANRTASAEVAGDAAVLVDPDDSEAIAEGLDRILSDADLRAELRARGPARAVRFTWRACAEATLQAYRDLAAMGPKDRGQESGVRGQ